MTAATRLFRPLCATAMAACASAAAVAGIPAGAPADDLTALEIEQLLNLEVVTASRIAQKLSDVPASVSVITAEEIRHFGYRTLADILRSVRGVYVTYDRNYSYVGTRGLGRPGDLNTRLLVLVDGRRLNDAAYDQGAAGTEFPIDVELIERIEFVPGPGSAIYGSSAFFGVINVITRTGASLGHSEATVSRASYDTTRVRVASGHQLADGKVDLLLGASSLRSEGDDLYFPEFDDAASHGMARGLDHDRYRRLFAKASALGVTAEAYFGRRTKGIPTAAYGQQFAHPDSVTTDEYTVAALSWQGALARGTDLYASLSTNRYRYFGTFIFARDGTLNRDVSETHSSTAEVRVSSTLPHQRLVAGLEYVHEKRLLANFDLQPYASYLDINVPRQRYGIYLQDDIRLGERFGVNLGVRHDHDAEGGNSNNPRVALLYRATPQVTFKALAGSAFRSANAYERYYETAVDYKRNLHLRPERIRTSELSVEYFPTDRFRASAALYQYRMRDLLALTTDPADGWLFFSNIDAARSRGAEFETEWLGGAGARLKTSVSVQNAVDDASGAWLTNSPRRLFKLNYSTPLAGDLLRVGVDLRAVSRRRTPLDATVPGYGHVNLTVATRVLHPRLELSVSLYNAFDKRYADGPSEEHFDNSDPPRYLRSLAQPGRNWRVMLTREFR
ncbi:MAG: TonB-dependent receptor plug domain-containing protein [Gammaproteobacteria bacterium]